MLGHAILFPFIIPLAGIAGVGVIAGAATSVGTISFILILLLFFACLLRVKSA